MNTARFIIAVLTVTIGLSLTSASANIGMTLSNAMLEVKLGKNGLSAIHDKKSDKTL